MLKENSKRMAQENLPVFNSICDIVVDKLTNRCYWGMGENISYYAAWSYIEGLWDALKKCRL